VATELRLNVSGTPADDGLRSALQLIEIEENADGPTTMLIRLPVNRTSDGDLDYVSDGSFDPMTNLSVVLTMEDGSAHCVFDGYVLSWRLHLDRTSSTSTIDVWAQDASWLMGMDETVREWTGMTDGEIANEIFDSYGFMSDDANTNDDSPQHDDDSHTLLQRASDLRFLRGLARRNGKLLRVACTDTPGERTGYFVRPDLTADPSATLTLSQPETWNIDALDFEWDVLRPTDVQAAQVDLASSSSDGVAGNASDSGLAALGERDYATYAGNSSTVLLTPSADVAELAVRTCATLREAQWFVRCKGETTADDLGAILRVGTIVSLEGAGSLHSGNWLVWSVVHRITTDRIGLVFTLVRNSVGGSGSLSTLLEGI
jgi:phage protein D